MFGRDAFALRGIYASGGVGFVHDMVTAAGGDNVFADAKREAIQATTELIIARAPEMILELRAEPMDRGAKEKEVRTWSSLVSVPAVRSRERFASSTTHGPWSLARGWPRGLTLIAAEAQALSLSQPSG